MKVALVHYWLVNFRGGERVLEAIGRIFPEADIFTHVFLPDNLPETLTERKVSTSFINSLPRAGKWYQYYLPLMPMALEQLDLRGYDLIISSESGPAKGIIADPYATHLCYCHTPMRYIWDMRHDYMDGAGRLKKFICAPLLHYMRMWDVSASTRVDAFAANSLFTARRIEKYYRRDARVIYPPVNAEYFHCEAKREDFYLIIGELVPYKRADLAVSACVKSGKKLVVIGKGPDLKKLSRNAPPNVTFMGHQPASVVRDHLARCRALLFPGQEDFGIVPVEAMASGAPVIAYARGGVTETVIDGVTGLHFHSQNADSLAEAIAAFERMTFDRTVLAEQAAKFSCEHFEQNMRSFIDDFHK